ncbi:MAG: HD domain-containing phosphohydrolase [Elusimicrobiota bacterium]
MKKTEKTERMSFKIENLREEINELSALLDSMRLINSTLDFHVLLDYLMDLAKQVTDSEAASALLVEGEHLCFVAASGKKSSEIKKVYLDKEEGIAGWVVGHGQPLVIDDVEKDKRFSHKADKSSGFITKSVLAIPLKMENKVIGVVEAVNKTKNRKYNRNDIRILQSLANSAAVAINKAQLYADLKDLFMSTITAFAKAIEAKDPYTRGHSERVRDISVTIAKEMGFSEKELKELEITALLHDVGKIGVPETVLRKEGKLEESEYAEMKKHPAIGAEILSSIKQLNMAIPGIKHHQEHYNGKGYPDKLSGTNIPLFARIIAVADTFDAMTSDRPYRKHLSDQEGIAELKRCSGIQFDGDCVRAFIRSYEKGRIQGMKP